jgi:FkbM family methyltransferase
MFRAARSRARIAVSGAPPEETNRMHVALLLVGSHDGRKLQDVITEAATHGAVILIEPVPHLFEALLRNHGDKPNVRCLNCCVALQSGMVTFFAPTDTAASVIPEADQLGSMSRHHAVAHHAALAEHIREIQVAAVTVADLLRQFDIGSIDLLITDTEGHDADLLASFPFDLCAPNQIVFEYKHSDGPVRIGRKLGQLLIRLDNLGYDIRVLDVENCLAVRRPRASPSPSTA